MDEKNDKTARPTTEGRAKYTKKLKD